MCMLWRKLCIVIWQPSMLLSNLCLTNLCLNYMFYCFRAFDHTTHSGSAIFSEGQTDESHNQFAKNNGKFTQTISLSPQLLQLAVFREGLQYVIHGGAWGTDLEFRAGSSMNVC